MGIYVGGGWFVHSSSQGTTLQTLAGWYSSVSPGLAGRSAKPASLTLSGDEQGFC